eukprot:7184150-Pyramimonas_sp.AAC.1
MDERGAECSQEMLDWAGQRNVKMRVAPGEAYQALGPVERARQVMRETTELWFEEAGLERTAENLKTALDY